MLLEALFSAVAEAVFGYLLQQSGLAERVRAVLGLDPERRAFQTALAQAYDIFHSKYPEWTASLFDETFLTSQAVVPLLADLLTRRGRPDPAHLARLFAAHLGHRDPERLDRLGEATRTAADFLNWLEAELAKQPDLQPLYDSRALERIAGNAEAIHRVLEEIREHVRRGEETLITDVHTLRQALQEGQITLATGDRAVALGGSADGAIIITGEIRIELDACQRANLEILLDEPPTDVNPFVYGPPVPPERFCGRREQLAEIKNRIGALTAQCVNIVGQRRSGKTSILRYIQERSAQFFRPKQNPLLIYLDFQDTRFHTPAGILEGLRRGIEQATGSAPWSHSDNDDPYAVEDGLRAVQQQGQQLIILIDEFERIGARLEHFQDWGNDWRAKASAEMFVLVIATLRPLDEIYARLNLTSPFANLFSTTILGALEEPAWHQLVRDGFEQSGKGEFFLANQTQHLALIDELSGGLPYYVQMAAALLWQYHDPTKVREGFAFQSRPRFRELWDDLTRPEQLALRAACGLSQTPLDPLVWDVLRRYGLLRPDGRPFSSAFAGFVKTRPVCS